MTPSVGCAVVTFNHERWVREALDGILAQDEPRGRVQLAVVDNGSTDTTPEILREYEDRAQVHRIPAGPVNAAFNLALERVGGDYLTVFSGDDVWTPGRLDHMVELMEREPDVGLLYGDMELIDGDGRSLHPSAVEQSGLRLPPGPPLGDLMRRNVVFGPALLMRASLRRALLPIPVQAAWEDWWFATAAARVARVAHTPRVVARYRRHGSNLTVVDSEEKRAHVLREELRFRGWLLQTAAPGDATADELLRAAAEQARAARALGRPASGGARRRARDAARAAQAAADPVERLLLCANAVGHDAGDAEHLRALEAAAAAARGARGLGPVSVERVVEDAREHVTLAFAAELLERPELLAGYARAVGPDDPATLAIFAPGEYPGTIAQRLEGAFAGLESLPDMVLVTLPATPAVEAALAVRAGALLSVAVPTRWPFASLPRFAAAQTAVTASPPSCG